jgi:hypothetical protein
VKKKKLLVILGAGSSMPCGMPSVSGIEDLMEKWSGQWAACWGFCDHYRSVHELMREYFCQGHGRPRPTPNFEKTLGEMIALVHWMTPPPYGEPLRHIACEGIDPPKLHFKSAAWPTEMTGPFAPTTEIRDQLATLLVKLAKYFRALCVNVDTSSEKFAKYLSLMSELNNSFELGVYNLNYDVLSDLSLPNAFTGFDANGDFAPRKLHRQSAWMFNYHLHGSVHHSLWPPRGNGPIVWRTDLRGDFNDGDPNNPADKRTEGKPLPVTTLIAGGFKLDQMLVEPFHSFHAALVRHVYEADAILIGGYGFADEHVNRALNNRLADATNRPPVLVLDKATDSVRPTSLRDDAWAKGMTGALAAPRGFFKEPGEPEFLDLPAHLAARHAFEVLRPSGVALWHGGFVEATVRLDSIVEWLSGADDSALLT